MKRFFPILITILLFSSITGCTYREAEEPETLPQESVEIPTAENAEAAVETQADTEVETMVQPVSPTTLSTERPKFRYATDEEWHTPRYMYNQKYLFNIHDLVYSEDDAYIYIAADIPEIHKVHVDSGKTEAVYQTEKSAAKLIFRDNMLYCVEIGVIEIWDTATGVCTERITYPALNDKVYNAILVGNTIILHRELEMDFHPIWIQSINLEDGSSATYTFQDDELITALMTDTGLDSCIFDEKHGRIFGMRRAEDQIYCYDIASGKLSTLPKNPDAIVKFYVNEDTGNFFRITSVPGSYSIECTIFDTSYQIIRETKYAGQDSLDYHINYPPRDVTKDETVLVLEDNYGNILLLDTTKNDTYVWLEGSYRNEVAIKLVNPVCLMISGYDTLPWQLYNITTGDYCIYSEEYLPYVDTILGECYIAEGTDTFTLYRYGGEIAVYSHLLGENMDTLPGEPDIATNALTRDHSTDQWHTGDKFETVAISPDGKYQVVMEAGRRYDESVCHSAEFDYYTYWLTEAASGEQLFAIRFPKNRFMSVAVKDQERAAILDNGGIYYEFNPQNGEIYKCGRLVMETESEMSLVQMVVDFEDGRVSVIGQNRLRAANPTKRKSMYSGGLFSTDTYELIYAYDTVLIGDYDYPAGFGYMKADAQCDHLYFKDTFAIEHLVLTLPNGKE